MDLGLYLPSPTVPVSLRVVLATNEGRDVLLERIARVRGATNPGAEYAKLASGLGGVVALDVDIDTGVALPVKDGRRSDVVEVGVIGDLIACINGETLDGFGRLWLRGKECSPPEEPRPGSTIAIPGWQPGDLVAWTDVFPAVRKDLYALDGRVFEASEMYCAVPDCTCEDVVVQFETHRPRGGPPQGRVIVPRSGVPAVEPSKNGVDRLERLWAAFQNRHPKHLDRFGGRCSLHRS